MATGRKGMKQPPASGERPARSGDASELVAIARGLAAAVSEHGLTELIIDTPEATFTVRRGGAMVAVPQMQMAPMPQMQMAPMPMAPPSSPVTPPFTPPPPALSGAAPAPHTDEKVHVVKSPFVGTFYRRPNPDSPEYAKLNDKVSRGSVLCIIEAMKLMNEIESDIAGTIVAVLAEDGAPVEYDQPLFKIAPA